VASRVNRERVVLALNSGSSSRKAALYAIGPAGERALASAAAERLDTSAASLWTESGGRKVRRALSGDAARAAGALDALLTELEGLGLPAAEAVGHRLVHGGAAHSVPALVTDALLAELDRLVPFAPLHLPGELAGIREVARRSPGVPQVACFDTAFHRAMPEVAARFALPRDLYDAGVRRYGFHGLSYEYVLEELGPNPPARVVIAHLGNGASLAALKNGKPIDTSMGLSPTGGVMMGTRSGDLDPGVLLYLMRERGLDASAIERLVNDEAGLLGISGLSSDMKALLDARAANSNAELAVEMFCYQVKKFIGAFAAALGGLDVLVFTGGIGEHAAPVRRRIAGGLEHLGIRLDDERNRAGADPLTFPESPCAVRIIGTNEDLTIARHTARRVFSGSG
jgi:acetate kinase